jgi:hypothetical protein
MSPKRIADDDAPKARKPRAPKERPPSMTNRAWAADVERRQTETCGKAEREKKFAEKRNTDLAFLIGGNDDAMDEVTRSWYNAHRQEILRPPSIASASPSTTSTPAADDASSPEAQEGTVDEPVVV